jgi:hypothetical protein
MKKPQVLDPKKLPYQLTIRRARIHFFPIRGENDVVAGTPTPLYIGQKVQLIRATRYGPGDFDTRIFATDHARTYGWLSPGDIEEGDAFLNYGKRRKNPVRDPSHKKLLRGLSKHFARDEAALRRMKKNPSRGEFDQHAATELVIYADGTRELVPQKEAIARNLLRKMRAGTYDSTRAVVAWRHWIDAAAKRYAKEFGTGNMAEIFSVPTREWAAREIAHRNQLMLNAGEWDWILAKKNPGRKHHSAKWRRCVRKVKKRGGAASPYAVCTKAVKNPRGFVIVARRRGETLYFDGKKHFSDRHRPHVFSTHEAALKRGRELVRAYGDALARYRITVEPAPGK